MIPHVIKKNCPATEKNEHLERLRLLQFRHNKGQSAAPGVPSGHGLLLSSSLSSSSSSLFPHSAELSGVLCGESEALEFIVRVVISPMDHSELNLILISFILLK